MAAKDHFGPQLQMFIPAGAFEEAAREENPSLVFADLISFEEGYPPEQPDMDTLKRVKLRQSAMIRTDDVDADEYREARLGEETLMQGIRREGVKKPVTLWHEDGGPVELGDGQHRVFAAASIDPKMEIPVRHK